MSSSEMQLLRAVDLFTGMDSQDLQSLARRVVISRYRAGEMVFNYGEAGSAMYIVAEGHVNIHLPGEASRRVSLADITVGEYFGELSLLDSKPRSASALATTDVVLLELSQEALSRCVEQSPQIAMSLLRNMSGRIRETNTLLSQRVARNAEEEFQKQLTWGDRLADRIAALNGSWAFIGLLIGLTGAWAIVNTVLMVNGAFDPYPYEFFNLLLAVLIALQGPLIVMSQNRQVSKDRTQARIDFEVNLKNEVNIATLVRELSEFRREMDQRLTALTTQPSDSRPTGRGRPAAGASGTITDDS